MLSKGFTISEDQLKSIVSEYVPSQAVNGWQSLSSATATVKSDPRVRWVSPLEIKNAVEKAFITAFGEKAAVKAKPSVGPYATLIIIRSSHASISGAQAQESYTGGRIRS
jgi:hypothetical protein